MLLILGTTIIFYYSLKILKKKKTFQSEPICFLATPEANLIS